LRSPTTPHSLPRHLIHSSFANSRRPTHAGRNLVGLRFLCSGRLRLLGLLLLLSRRLLLLWGGSLIGGGSRLGLGRGPESLYRFIIRAALHAADCGTPTKLSRRSCMIRVESL